MAGQGPTPKDDAKRVRRNKTAEPLKVKRGAKPTTAPELLPSPVDDAGNEIGWLPETIEWWNTWATSEQATLFLASDWQRLRMLLPLVDRYFELPSKDLMAEIRLNEERLGATLQDRQRLRLKIQADDGEEEEDPKRRGSRSRKRPDPRGRLKVVDGGA